MLNIYTANHIESLLGQLCYNVQEQPLSSPFETEIIAVSNSAMEKWLQINISQVLGIEANYSFPLPASLLWSILNQYFSYLDDSDPLSRSHLQWRIFAQLPELLALPEFAVLANYIQTDRQGVKRWQLASQIADIFDRYQYYRADWLDMVDDDNQWQTALWHYLIQDIQQHKTQLIAAYIQQLQAGNITLDDLPERISLFAPSRLPPLVLDTLLQLANVIQIDFYLLSPTNQYWLDLVSQKVEAKIRLSRPDEAQYMETGNRLLSSWGRQGQVFFDQLVAISEQAQEYKHFQAPAQHSVLQHIKYDIYHLQDADVHAEKIVMQDNSIAIHLCHSPLREIQVLHDNLLRELDQDHNLRPEDILVVAPNISDYAAYIEAVFRPSKQSVFIPWNISDVKADNDIPLLRIFLQLFNLPDSRFTQSEILAYLDVPEVRNKFLLVDTDISIIQQWLEAGAVRWGKSAQHKAGLHLPAMTQNTWEQAKERLFMGYAIGEIDTVFEQISPLAHIEGNNSEILGKFWQLYACLEHFSQQLQKQQSLVEWQKSINQLLTSFFDDQQLEESYLQTIRDTVDQLMSDAEGIAADTLLSRQLLRSILEENLAEVGHLHHFMSGGISFSGFKPMRNLPFKVIAVLGLNDTSFPRQMHKIEFDLMQKNYKLGDPNARDEDRYLFLETLLSAQDKLIISYVGRDVKDNTEKQASVLLKELLDYIDIRFSHPQQKSGQCYSQFISYTHRLQAYHSSYFQNQDEQKSYAYYWCNIAKKMTPSIADAVLQWQQRPVLDTPDSSWNNLEITRLIRFFKHPMRFFFQQRLGIYLHHDKQPIHDDEPFALNALEHYQLKNTLLDEWLTQRNQTIDKTILHAKGILPHGQMADEVMGKINTEIDPVIIRAKQLLGDALPQPLPFEQHFSTQDNTSWHIQGNLAHVYPQIGWVEMKAAKLNGADQIGFWINYMCYRLAAPNGYCLDAYFIDSDACYSVKANNINAQDAKQYLQVLLETYSIGVCKPLAVLPRSSYALIQAQNKHQTFAGTASPAWQATGQFNQPAGDLYDPYVQLALHGLSDTPLDSPEFSQLANTIYQWAATLRKTPL